MPAQPVAHFLGSGDALADNAGRPGVEVVGNGGGGAALAGGIPSLQNNRHPQAVVDDPFLEHQKLAAQNAQLSLVGQVFNTSKGGHVMLGRRSFGEDTGSFRHYIVSNHSLKTVQPTP